MCRIHEGKSVVSEKFVNFLKVINEHENMEKKWLVDEILQTGTIILLQYMFYLWPAMNL